MIAEKTLKPRKTLLRRVRVPLGFVAAIVFLVFARPTAWTLLASLPLTVAGVALRAYAAGYVKKNAELTMTGPYAYTRNPLYLGSLLLTVGFAGAGGRWLTGVLLVAVFLAIYLPTIAAEEVYLRGAFAGFDAYAARVPRLVPRLTPRLVARPTAARLEGSPPGQETVPGRFDPERYKHHREYNAGMGAAAVYAALLLLAMLHRH